MDYRSQFTLCSVGKVLNLSQRHLTENCQVTEKPDKVGKYENVGNVLKIM